MVYFTMLFGEGISLDNEVVEGTHYAWRDMSKEASQLQLRMVLVSAPMACLQTLLLADRSLTAAVTLTSSSLGVTIYHLLTGTVIIGTPIDQVVNSPRPDRLSAHAAPGKA